MVHCITILLSHLSFSDSDTSYKELGEAPLEEQTTDGSRAEEVVLFVLLLLFPLVCFFMLIDAFLLSLVLLSIFVILKVVVQIIEQGQLQDWLTYHVNVNLVFARYMKC